MMLLGKVRMRRKIRAANREDLPEELKLHNLLLTPES